jgi:hypothetical protein
LAPLSDALSKLGDVRNFSIAEAESTFVTEKSAPSPPAAIEMVADSDTDTVAAVVVVEVFSAKLAEYGVLNTGAVVSRVPGPIGGVPESEM